MGLMKYIITPGFVLQAIGRHSAAALLPNTIKAKAAKAATSTSTATTTAVEVAASKHGSSLHQVSLFKHASRLQLMTQLSVVVLLHGGSRCNETECIPPRHAPNFQRSFESLLQTQVADALFMAYRIGLTK